MPEIKGSAQLDDETMERLGFGKDREVEIFDVRIYDRHLSEEEVIAAYQDSFIKFPASEEMRRSLDDWAQAEGRSRGSVLRELVREGLERRVLLSVEEDVV